MPRRAPASRRRARRAARAARDEQRSTLAAAAPPPPASPMRVARRRLRSRSRARIARVAPNGREVLRRRLSRATSCRRHPSGGAPTRRSRAALGTARPCARRPRRRAIADDALAGHGVSGADSPPTRARPRSWRRELWSALFAAAARGRAHHATSANATARCIRRDAAGAAARGEKGAPFTTRAELRRSQLRRRRALRRARARDAADASGSRSGPSSRRRVWRAGRGRPPSTRPSPSASPNLFRRRASRPRAAPSSVPRRAPRAADSVAARRGRGVDALDTAERARIDDRANAFARHRALRVATASPRRCSSATRRELRARRASAGRARARGPKTAGVVRCNGRRAGLASVRVKGDAPALAQGALGDGDGVVAGGLAAARRAPASAAILAAARSADRSRGGRCLRCDGRPVTRERVGCSGARARRRCAERRRRGRRRARAQRVPRIVRDAERAAARCRRVQPRVSGRALRAVAAAPAATTPSTHATRTRARHRGLSRPRPTSGSRGRATLGAPPRRPSVHCAGGVLRAGGPRARRRRPARRGGVSPDNVLVGSPALD